MAVGARLPSLSEAASAIGAYFAGERRTKDEGRCNALMERPKGEVVKNPKAEVAKPLRTAVARPRFAPEFDGLHCFETLVSQ